jgi:hypothetical protein
LSSEKDIFKDFVYFLTVHPELLNLVNKDKIYDKGKGN